MTQKQTSMAAGGERAAYYLGVPEEHHEDRGGSLRAFAAERGLSVWTFYDWRRRLGRTRRRSRGTSGLVAVDVVEEARPASEATDGFEVILSDGCRVRVPVNFAAARLVELIAVLRSC